MTATDYAARKKRMAAILSAEEQAHADDVSQTHEPASSPSHAPPMAAPSLDPAIGGRLIEVPLDDIEIDPHQPRQFLPSDVRSAFANRQINYLEVLAQMMTRIANGDLEAEAYLTDIRALAEDIQAHGQLNTALVYTDKSRDGRTRYRLIDGERRFWAHVYLSTQPSSTVTGLWTGLRAELRDEFQRASAGDIQSMQWSANMQRESVCAVDIAEFVHARRDEAIRRMQANPQLLAQLREGEPAITPRDAAQRLVCRDLAYTFGRPLKRRAYYQYLSLAERLSAPVKALARAYKLPLGRLIQLTSKPEAEKMAAVLQMIKPDATPAGNAAQAADKPKRPGRPTRSQSRIRLAERALAGMDADTEQIVLRWDKDELAAVLQRDRDLLEATDRHMRLLQGVLSRR
jgi:hypothetical protein